MNDFPPSSVSPEEPEVGKGSMWLLRGGLIAASLVVLGFLAMAVVSLLDNDASDETLADFLATTTTLGAVDDGESTDDGDAQPADDDAGSDDGPTDPAEAATLDQAELDAFVDEAITFIEDARQLEFLERPDVRVVSVEEMTQQVLDELEFFAEDDPELIAIDTAFSRAIGFYGPEQDLFDINEIFVSSGVAGVYFPRTDEMYVRSAGALTVMTKVTIVHELVHALDDQHFDISRDVGEGDLGWAFTAAVEGSATYVENLFRDALSAAEQQALAEEELAIDPGDLFSLDFGFLIYQTAVYEAGDQWLQRRMATEGVAAIDDALTNPPPTSEVVFQPLDAGNLEPVDVSAPDVDGEVVWQGVGGQALVSAVTFITDRDGAAANGWGGDQLTVYLDGSGNECLRWDLVGDTPTDTAELLQGLEVWLADIGGSVTTVDGVVRVDRCA